MSPLTLRRRYLPRGGRGLGPPPAHPQAAAAAAAPQAQHPNTIKRHESKTKDATASNGSTRIKLTPFKPGFERDTEDELAKAFYRPARLFKEDTPFYPWLPKFTPLVNFHLNFRG
nr:MAG: hypothetical protein [Gammatorquevirus sp.]